MAYIGIDMGTSGCKLAKVTDDGRIERIERRSYDIITPLETWAELDPAQVWQAIKDGLSALAPYCGDVSAVAVSTIGEAMVLTGTDDTPLTNAILYLDDRSVAEFERVRDTFGSERIYDITGTQAISMFSLYRLLWIKEHLPEVYSKTRRIFLFEDYISYMLSGKRGISPSLASRTAFYDVVRGEWSGEIMDFFGIDKALMSPVLPSGTALGPILPELARELGLPETLEIVVGCHDQCAALLGGGAVEPGDTVSSQGSTESYNILIRDADSLRAKRLPYEPFVNNDHVFAVVGQLSHGTSIRWFAEKIEEELFETCEKDGRDIYEILNERCAPSSQGVVYLPYLSDICFDGRNASFGGFMGIRPRTDKSVLYRALLEGVSFEARVVLTPYEKMGMVGKKLRMVGGASASSLLMQLKADILQHSISVLEEKENGILGLAMVCAVAQGRFGSYAEAAAAFVREKKNYHPQRDYSEKYSKYIKFAELSTNIKL